MHELLMRNGDYGLVSGRVQTRSLEVHIVDHCNLPCWSCCSLSPYLPPGRERRDCEAQLCQKLTAANEPEIWLESETEVARGSDQPSILRALYAYRSQARSFLGSRRQFIAACKSHARWLGLNCWRVERFWKPLSK